MVLTTLVFSQESKRAQRQTLKGTVVAQNIGNNFQTCWHVCSLRLVVRLEQSNPVKYAVVSVAYMDEQGSAEKGSQWKLIELSRKWVFKASPMDPATDVLKEFATVYDVETREDVSEKMKMKEWSSVTGAEDEQLPFGQLIPKYSVDVGKFKAID